MKLIALKDFARVQSLEDVKIENSLHGKIIHKGAEFEIGTAKTIKELAVADRLIVAQLMVSGSAGDATDKELVKAVKEDVAIDKKREENAAKLNANASNTALVEQLTALLAKAAAGAK